MYSGTTLTRASGRILGAHQKIDRLAEKQLSQLLNNDKQFPKIRQILHFEGCNGPDGIKRKSPAKDEPWHFFQPFDLSDNELLEIIESHYKRLVMSLKQRDEVRASFEAAWLAHAIVDGLTPAHQYPYGEKVAELSGKSLDRRQSVRQKIMMPGESMIELCKNNWKFWGPKGLFITHAAFEVGIATLIKPLSIDKDICTQQLNLINSDNLKEWYRETAQSVARMELYDRFYKHGWTREIAKDVRKQLLPILVRSVALAWHGAVQEASL